MQNDIDSLIKAAHTNLVQLDLQCANALVGEALRWNASTWRDRTPELVARLEDAAEKLESALLRSGYNRGEMPHTYFTARIDYARYCARQLRLDLGL